MGGVLGLYLLGFCTRRGGAKAVWFGVVLTILFSLWTVLAKQNLLPSGLHVPFDLYYTGIIGQIVMFAGIFTAALLLSDGKKHCLISPFGHRVSNENWEIAICANRA